MASAILNVRYSFQWAGYLKSSGHRHAVVFSIEVPRSVFPPRSITILGSVTLIDSTCAKFVMAFVRALLAPHQFAKDWKN